MTNEQINEMVNRFLRWKLPKGFCPDAGISFTPSNGIPYEGDEYGNSWWPIGTNLLSADQAHEMIVHMVGEPLYTQAPTIPAGWQLVKTEDIQFCIDAIQDWGAYASEYSCHKWNLAGDIRRAQAMLDKQGELK